jgi:hypothetical protein
MGVRKDEEEDAWFFFPRIHPKRTSFFEADYDWVSDTLGTPYFNHQQKGKWSPPNGDKPLSAPIGLPCIRKRLLPWTGLTVAMLR